MLAVISIIAASLKLFIIGVFVLMVITPVIRSCLKVIKEIEIETLKQYKSEIAYKGYKVAKTHTIKPKVN